jgi:pyruvate dehydrogenase E1 component beta subunit
LKAAIRDPDPCVVFENELLYGEKFEVSEAALDVDYLAPIGKLRIMREGTDMTIISHGSVVGKAVEAAEIAKEKYGNLKKKQMFPGFFCAKKNHF